MAFTLMIDNIDNLIVSFKLLKVNQSFVYYQFLNTVCRDALGNIRVYVNEV